MTFEGNNIRKFTEQKSASFLLSDSIVNNVTGEAYFGFSGESKSIQWKFKEGKIYDPDDNYIFSYSPSEGFTLSGDISKDYYTHKVPRRYMTITKVQGGKIIKIYSPKSRKLLGTVKIPNEGKGRRTKKRKYRKKYTSKRRKKGGRKRRRRKSRKNKRN